VNTSSGPESKDQGHRLKVPSPGRRSIHYPREVPMRTLTVVWVVALLGVLGSNVQVSIAAAATIAYLVLCYRNLPPRKAHR
jgi:hypothetical protein